MEKKNITRYQLPSLISILSDQMERVLTFLSDIKDLIELPPLNVQSHHYFGTSQSGILDKQNKTPLGAASEWTYSQSVHTKPRTGILSMKHGHIHNERKRQNQQD